MKVSIELRKKVNNNDLGTLNIRITNNNKRKYKSLKTDIPIKQWNVNKQKVRSSYKYAKEINEFLISELAKYNVKGEHAFKLNNTIAVDFFNNEIMKYKPSTRTNYLNALKCFKSFLDDNGLTNIKLDDLNNDIINNWLDCIDNNTTQNANTKKTNLTIIKSLVNKAIDLDIVNYHRHPMQGIKVKRSKPKITYLTKDEVIKLFNFKGNKADNIAKDIYLFQIFCQGMRISDALFLKWDNFNFRKNEIWLQYNTIKNKKEINLKANHVILKIIDSYLLNDVKSDNTILNKLYDDLEYLNKQIESKKIEISSYSGNESKGILKDISIIAELPNPFNHSNEIVKDIDTLNKEMELLIKKRDNKIVEIFKHRISKMDKNKNLFFFNDNINSYSGNEMTLKQNKSKNIVISTLNMRLKRICKEINIKPINTHSSRHTYTMIAINNEMNIDDISISLGHSNIRTTYNYIHKLPTNRLTDKMDSIVGKFI